VPQPLKAGDVICLASSVVLGVEEFDDQITLALIDETKESTPAKDPAKEYTIFDRVKFPVTDKGAVIGKLKKHSLTMFHANCSGTHCTFTPNHITDGSSYGVQKVLRSLEEYVNSNSQSGWQLLEKTHKISTFDFEF